MQIKPTGERSGITDQRSMAGTVLTDLSLLKTLEAAPVHWSVWLASFKRVPPVRVFHLRGRLFVCEEHAVTTTRAKHNIHVGKMQESAEAAQHRQVARRNATSV
jgi:hypothetical protein